MDGNPSSSIESLDHLNLGGGPSEDATVSDEFSQGEDYRFPTVYQKKLNKSERIKSGRQSNGSNFIATNDSHRNDFRSNRQIRETRPNPING